VIQREWARTSLTVWSGPNEQQYEMSSDTLAGQLAEAEVLLRGLSPNDEVRDDALSVRLLNSWTPRDGQRATSLSPELVQALAAAGGAFWMDFYPADSEEQATPR
jgi:hypothetical protein